MTKPTDPGSQSNKPDVPPGQEDDGSPGRSENAPGQNKPTTKPVDPDEDDGPEAGTKPVDPAEPR